ncbi:MAG: (2Fe-2S)-binding protein [Betaproteobacteria bacterium]|nr:MAG: (2Fe-2S)-binding protein [Betaproteobacteria bacterium]
MPNYRFSVNGESRSVESRDPAQPLLYVLRNALGLTGAKFGCGEGQCGSCAVLLDGKVAYACLTPVSAVAGRTVTTIEGLGTALKPHPVQAAFIAEQAAQCGYCASGMVMKSVELLAANPKPTRDEVKAALAGHLCRCGTHERILRAVARAAGAAMPGGTGA